MSIVSLSQQNIYTGSLILVNAAYGYRKPEHDDLVTDTVPLNRRAATLLRQLIQTLGGWEKIVPVSGWRSTAEQQSIWDNSMVENGESFTRTFVALPGHSEHETGLAIDLALNAGHIDFICPSFPYDGICQKFRSLAASYGFVERYPAGKEHVTGIGHEPWHFRYVGVPHAFIMTEHGFVLEEYLDFLREYPFASRPLRYQNHGLDISVSYQMAAEEGCTLLRLDDSKPYSVSGNNMDGFIITEWRHSHADN